MEVSNILTYIYSELDSRRENDSLIINLNFPEVLNKDTKLTLSPNPFSPIDLIGKDKCEISYNLPFDKSRIVAFVYNFSGIEVKKLFDADVKEKIGCFYWDGTNENNFYLPQGAYILYFEANDSATDNVFTEKAIIVIGK